jgi:glycogen synthase
MQQVIWLLTFESTYTKKVGGLAEVPPRLAKSLIGKGYKAYVLTPSHGFESPMEKELHTIIADDATYYVKLYEADGIPHIVFHGGIMDDPVVYAPGRTLKKSKMWAKIIAEYAVKSEEKPNIIHGNDWHSVPPLLKLKTVLREDAKYYYQVHLLTNTMLSLKDVTDDIGVSATTKISGIHGTKTIMEYYRLSHGSADRLGGLISDKLITVSRNYAREIVRMLGLDLEDHVDFIPNATTWRLDDILGELAEVHGFNRVDILKPDDRRLLRQYVELEALDKLPQNEPVVSKEYEKILKDLPKPGKFDSEGPLVFMTGRIARQKGVSVLLRTLDNVIVDMPSIRIILMLIPVWGSETLIKDLVEASIVYRENLRVIIGRTKFLYRLVHTAGDVMVLPSLYEPFGLAALEGMLTGNMIVASRTGGLAETVLNICSHGLRGTGLHAEPGNPSDLALKLVDATAYMETGYYEPWSERWLDLIDTISEPELRRLLYSNPKAPWITRRASLERSQQYTWEKSAEKALKIYGLM